MSNAAVLNPLAIIKSTATNDIDSNPFIALNVIVDLYIVLIVVTLI